MSTNTGAVKTGSEVLAYCSACKMDLAAVVLAMDGAKIQRVQCKTCKKERAYKAPKGVTEPGATPPKKSGRKPKETAEEAKAAQSKTIAAEWQTIMENAAKKSKRVKYTPKTSLTVGDIVEHPTFGDGVVMKLLFPNKAEIIFKTDIKIMMHSL